MSLFRRLTILGLVIVIVACAPQGALRSPPASSQQTPATTTAPNPIDIPCVQTSHGCIALNPDVTEATIEQTICVSGYTKSVRPGTTYTNGIKAKLLREAGEGSSRMAAYELDHLIPLAVGGHPRKLSNFMLQPWDGDNSATEKDRLEVRLQHRVCRHEMDLAAAQHCIAENWQACAASLAAGRALPP